MFKPRSIADKFRSLLGRTRSIVLIVDEDALPVVGEVAMHIQDFIGPRRGWQLFAPKLYISRIPDSLQAAINPDGNSGIPHGYELEPGEVWVPFPAMNEPAGNEPVLKGHVDPVAKPNSTKSGGDDSAIDPVSRDAAQERRGGDTHESMPPVKIFSDARNASHPAIKSLRSAQV